MTTWEHHRDSAGHFHTLAIAGTDAYMKVEKSHAGDYFVTAMREGDSSGGEVEYRDTLAQAKKEAERIVTAGEWGNFLQDAD